MWKRDRDRDSDVTRKVDKFFARPFSSICQYNGVYNQVNTLLEIVFAFKFWKKTSVKSRMKEEKTQHQQKQYG